MFQDFTYVSAVRSQSDRLRSAAQEFAALVRAYPNVSEIQLARLINLYADLSALDVALMISDDKLGPKLDRFVGDHRARIRTPFSQYAVLAGIALLGIATLLWTLTLGS